MKSFKQHLLESKQVYEFKIKIAGEPAKEQIDRLKSALAPFTVESFSTGTRSPIQETQIDFPEHKNISTTTYNVVLSYPATSFQVKNLAAEALGLSECCIKVRNTKEEAEYDINHANDQKSGTALLGTDYENECNQHLVGETHKMGLLKELSKVKHQGEQYKGVNDKLLASSVPSSKSSTTSTNTPNSSSVIGSRKVTLPTAKGKK